MVEDDETIEGLIENFKDNGIVGQFASHRIVSQFGQQALPNLLTALEDSNITVRQAAADALGILGNKKALQALEWLHHNELLKFQDGDEATREIVGKAIERIHQQQSR